MSITAMALIGLVLWTVILSVIMIGKRFTLIFGGDKELNTFSPEGKDIGEFGQRVTRAHANSLEVLPLAAAIMLLAIATENTAITDSLACIYLYCRIAQSVVHMISTSKLMVLIRATFFTVQIVFLVIWSNDLWKAASATQ
ncbi:MAG: MAPEG family protein [Pseudomonadota bacterium]|nr:MAPEG family protein [Pseudomonadota bacterium]